MTLSKISYECKLEEKSFVMAVNSVLERQGTDIRSLCWEGFEYMSVYNVYPNLEMDESTYKSYQLNYVTRRKSWRRRKTSPGAAYHDAQSLVWEAACASSDWRVYLKLKNKVKGSKNPPSENSVLKLAQSRWACSAVLSQRTLAHARKC